jgi:hypothetical protein
LLLFQMSRAITQLSSAAGDTGPGRSPVAAGRRGEVAGRLVELTLSTPAGLVPDMAGRGCTGWPICSADTCGRAASTG